MATTTNRDSLPLKYVLSCIAAATAETVTFPIDITKTRLQLQGERHALAEATPGSKVNVYRGMFRTCYGIIREEGVLSLYRGLRPALMRHVVYSGCRLTFYEVIRDHVFKKDKNGKYPLWKAIPTGMMSGAMGQFLASPADLVKIRLQMEGRRRLDGMEPRYRGTIHAFRSIVKSDGVLGLWKGWLPNCQRAAFVCLGDLTTYDTVKQLLLRKTSLQDNALTHCLSSICSGLVSATLGTPLDVMKSRMMNQAYKNGKGEFYSSTTDCLVKTVRGEGLLALYKGFVPIWSRMAPWSLTFWLVYEEVRVLAGVGNF